MSTEKIYYPHHLSFEDAQRYKAIKTQIRNRILVPREDFLFVKGADQRDNALAKHPYNKPPKSIIFGGYNTNPK